MVRNKKLKKSQVIVLIIAFLFYALMGLILYLFTHPEKLVGINDTKLGICYDMMAELKKENPKVQLFSIELKDQKMTAQFKYISQMVNENEDWLAFANEIRCFVTNYLETHKDHKLMTENWEMELICPGVIYSNCLDGKNYNNQFVKATYEKETNLYTAAGFLKKIASIGDVMCIVIDDKEAVLDEYTDISGLSKIGGLSYIKLQVKEVSDKLSFPCTVK